MKEGHRLKPLEYILFALSGTAIVNIGFNKEEAAEHLTMQSGGEEFVDLSLRQQIIAQANKNI